MAKLHRGWCNSSQKILYQSTLKDPEKWFSKVDADWAPSILKWPVSRGIDFSKIILGGSETTQPSFLLSSLLLSSLELKDTQVYEA